MTKTEARQVAARSQQYGHYHDRITDTLSVDCPRCKGRQSTARQHHYKPVRKGQPFSSVVDGKRCIYTLETVREALTRIMVDHLLSGECQPA